METMLAFVDDVTFFIRASVKSFHMIKSILEDFSSFTSLHVNHLKNNIVFSKQVHDASVIVGILGFQVQALPIKYLGVPISLYHTMIAFFLIADLQSIIARWSKRKLSYMGRVQLNSHT